MIKIVAPPRLKSKDFEEVKKSLADHSGEIMRVVKTLYEKYERPIEPQEFVLSWFSRQARVAEMLTDDGKNDIEGVVVWTVESPLYSDKVSGYVRFLFADTEERVVFGVVPEDTHAGHLLVKRPHAGHLLVVLFCRKVRHTDKLFAVSCDTVSISCRAGPTIGATSFS